MRLFITLIVSLTFAAQGWAADGPAAYASTKTKAYHIVLPGEPMPFFQVHRGPAPQPHRDDILGEQFQAGDTWYDYQSNGTVGKMIAVDPDGGVHITWMDGFSEDLAHGTRYQKYNYLSDDEWMREDGVAVGEGQRSGYGCIWLTSDENPRAMAFYHAVIGGDLYGMCGVDFDVGFGAFITAHLPRYPDREIIWPQGVMSPDGRIYVVYNRRDARMISYAQGEIDEEGSPVFGEVPVQISESHLNTYRIARSPVSERAAITWMYPRSGIPPDEGWDGFLAYQMHNDLMLAWTDDGDEWNFDDPLNVTDNIPPDPHREGVEAYGDTLFPFCTHDVIFDSDDNIHIVFEARALLVQPIPEDEPPIDGLTVDASFLFHWSEETGEITPVADGWWSHREVDDEGNTIRWPTPGAWKSNVCNPSLGYDEDGRLYCIYNIYPLNDYSVENYCNGDIAVTTSDDNGETWSMPVMITETRNHQADPGESLCECYPTLWEQVDDFLHISYELDTEPGTTIQDYDNRNEIATECLWYYLRVPVEDVINEEIWEDGPSWHALEVGVEEASRPWTPEGFRLTGVYPNPFNGRASVGFELRQGQTVEIAAYTADGRKAADIYTGNALRGRHCVAWNADELPTGVYIVRLTAGEAQSSMKAALVR